MTDPDQNTASSGGVEPGEITILLATHNGAAHLFDQLASITGQTDERWRLVVRDDRSTDSTTEMLAEASASDPRISWAPVVGPDMEVGLRYLSMLRLVDTELFAFADQDDLWEPNKLANARRALAATTRPVALAACDSQPVDHTLSPLGPVVRVRQGYRSLDDATLGRVLFQNPVPGHTILGTAALAALATTILDSDSAPALSIMHDWFVTLCAIAAGELVGTGTTDVHYRQHRSNARGAPSDHRGRFTNISQRSLAQRTGDIIGPAAAHSEALIRVLGSEDLAQHRPLLDSVTLCGRQEPASRAQLIRCWHQGAFVRPLPGQLALLLGAR